MFYLEINDNDDDSLEIDTLMAFANLMFVCLILTNHDDGHFS